MVAVSPNSHGMFLVNQILSTGPARALQNNRRGRREVVARDDRGHLLVLPRQRFSPLAVHRSLVVISLGRVARAFLAPGVLAVGAIVARTEGGVAPVALPVNAHANRFLDTQNVALGGMPLARLDLQTEPRTELLRALLVYLRPGDPSCIRILNDVLPRGRRHVFAEAQVSSRLDTR